MSSDFSDGDVRQLDRRSPRKMPTLEALQAMGDCSFCLAQVAKQFAIPMTKFSDPDYLVGILRGECRTLKARLESQYRGRGSIFFKIDLHRRKDETGSPIAVFSATYVSGAVGFFVPEEVVLWTRYTGRMELILPLGPLEIPSMVSPSRAAEQAQTQYLKLRLERVESAGSAIPRPFYNEEITDYYDVIGREADKVSARAHLLRRGIQ